MQPPPQTAPPGVGGPPPLPPSWNMHWRNGPYGRRANAPSSVATGPVQPVTDPFAFGQQGPRGSPLSGNPQGDPPLAKGSSSSAFPPAAAPLHLSSGELPHGPSPSFAPASAPQSGAGGPFSVFTASVSAFPRGATNSTLEMHHHSEQGPRHAVEQPQPTRMAPENSLLTSVPDRPPAGPDLSRNPGHTGATPTPLPAFSLLQQTLPQWAPPQSSAYLPYPEPLSRNTFGGAAHSSITVSQPGPQLDHHPTPPQQPGLPGGPQAPFLVAEAPSVTLPPSNAWQNPGGANAWAGQLPQEHFYLQPLEATYPSGHPTSQESNPSGHPLGVSEPGSRPCLDEAGAGTISMFFKGDEAENEEILSSETSERAARAEVEAFQQTMGHTYYQPLHAHQGPPAHFPPAQASAAVAAETAPKEADTQCFLRPAAAQQSSEKAPFLGEDRASSLTQQAGSRSAGALYENVENQECIQNQEVLPMEPPSQSRSSPGAASDSSRYASLAPLLPKKQVGGSHLEAGPNLEAPSVFPRPVRPDSVSSNYSNLSPRSAPGTARPQELATFIQQESGKPEQEDCHSFFEQIDSSPLGMEAGEQVPGKSYPGPPSQAPTPSPPKPMGVFQTSVNSSFEPVRAHSLGMKPTEADQAKVVAELREDRPDPRSAQRNPAVSVASPGNLEQPPDNLETLFLPPAHSLALSLVGSRGSPRQPANGSGMEKRPTSRAQGLGKKCESPAATLWAHNELPSFGGNVLLAPAAPAVYVPAKPSTLVVQPPEEALLSKPGSQARSLPSENLENPPKLGDEEAAGSQGSLGYASLLSSPPTETLHNQPVLLAQPSQSGSLAPPAGASLALQLGQPEKSPSAKDPGMAGMPSLGKNSCCGLSGENLPGGLVHSSASFFHGSQVPLNLAMDGPQCPAAEGLPLEGSGQPLAGISLPRTSGTTPPVGPSSSSSSGGLGGWSQNPPNCQDFSKALDLAGVKSQEPSRPGGGPQGLSRPLLGSQVFPPAPGPSGPGDSQARGPQQFYRQLTKAPAPGVPSDQGLPSEQAPAASWHPSASPSLQSPPGNPRAQAPSPKPCSRPPLDGGSAPPSHPQTGTDFRQDPRVPPGIGPPPGSTATTGTQLTRPPSRQEQPYPPSQNPQNAYGPPPYYYYRNPYDNYSYPPVDPRASHLYYQDAYGQYNSSYNQYDQAAAYRDAGSYWYSEPERPSSRASHTSERPLSRQDYPDDYYTTKSGWNGYYGDYYPYDNGDRYPSNYDARFRDPRLYDQRYWYNTDPSLYQKREPSQHGSSQNRYEDHWQYDPRFVSSFDEDLEPRRDPYGDDSDWRSVHSEHSGHSLHSSHSLRSRQSSFSSRSQQSQQYRSNHDLSVGAYDGDPQTTSLRADYPSGGYYVNQPPLSSYNPLAQIPWAGVEQVPSRPLTPEKFSVPHVCAKFGPGGQLIKVLPNLPSEGQSALVNIHSMEMVMQHFAEQEEMRAFPGPLAKDDTHKVDVINFAQNKATRCSQNDALIDKESARLLWDFVVLLCRQNGTVVGTDIAELLLQDHKTVWLPGKSPDEANLIDFTNEAVEQVAEESGEAQLSFLTDSLIATIDSLEKETERFRELLLYGRKKDALESAMKHGLWGHALLLASKMDSRTHARVMTRFANSLPINDPLQTVYQLMSGRMPAASTCCGDEKWGDWRPHLAMVLSNLTNNMDVESRTIITMGDTLASRGLLDAAHFCYLMAQVGFGVYTKKTTKLVLIGANHSSPFLKFASNEAIQRTEAYEYAQSLGTQPCSLPNFQVFKFIYACRLAEMGLIAQAFHYCEVISKAILTNPGYYSPVLVGQLIQISSQLRLFDPQIKEKPEQELFTEPNWLIQLRHLDGQIKDGSFGYSIGRFTPQQYTSSTPSSEPDQASQNEGLGGGLEVSSHNPLLASLLPNVVHPAQSVQLMPSAPPTILDGSVALVPPTQQEPAATGPFYPAMPSSLGPGPVPFSPYGAEQNSMYVGSSMLPAGLPPQGPELQPREGTQHEAVVTESPVWKAVPKSGEEDFYGKMANMGPGRRSRSTSQSSTHMGLGRRSRTTSESSVHSVGRERRNSAAKQPSSPPPSIPERKKAPKEVKKELAPQKSGGNWLSWLMGKSKNEAHLPDDKNKSIVWDEKKQRWINLDEPEEESKPPPPPPTGFPQALPSGLAGPPNASVSMLYRRAAGTKARYVDILNTSKAKSPMAAPAPADLFAPLAPMPIPANVFVPNSVPEEQTMLEGGVAQDQMAPGNNTNPDSTGDVPYLNPVAYPPGPELPASDLGDAPSGEVSSADPPTGAVQFYNPSQFAQPAAAPASSRLGRFGQRKYPTLK